MASMTCRWGIMSTATISRKTWQAIDKSGNSRLVAVASRDLSRSREFISQCQSRVPTLSDVEAFGDYDALIQSPNIDAIYIPLPTGLRKEWVVKAANAGKHVLC